MKLNMHIASVILCTALLSSFCNAYPYPVYWDREAFLEQLQQEERVGTDVEARIEQAGELQSCPNVSDAFYTSNTKRIRVSQVVVNGINISANFHYECVSSFILFVSHDKLHLILTYQRSQTPSIFYECLENSGTYQPSINTNGFPICFPKCPELSISNGDVEYDVDRLREPDTEATYSCNEDYTLQGERTRTCGRDGQWLGEEPKCIAVMCPELSDIPNGAVTVTNRSTGGIANYSCLEEYYLSGAQTRTCSQDGKWSCKEPTCFPLCPILSLPFGHIMYIFGNRKHGDIAAYSCRSGYRLVGPRERTCGQDGEWSGKEPRCEGFPLCPIPNIPLNGQVSYVNRKPDDIAAYSCNNGFQLIGPEERTCRQNGIWSGEEPVCEAIICPLVNILNGDVNTDRSPIRGVGGRRGFPVGTEVNYTCRPNFELQGKSTRTCLESGEWDPQSEPHCVSPLCPRPRLPNGRVNYGNRTLGDVAFYSCRYGYQLNGPKNRTCRQNGTWSGEDPVCEAIPKCPKLKLSDIPKNVPEADRKLKRHRDYWELRYKEYYNRRIEGDRSEGSKAYLKCVNGWQLLKGTPAVQTCVRENGALVWTKAGTCVFYYSYPSYG